MKGLSLFSNVGIAETYLDKNGIDIVVANELLPERASFFRHLYPSCNMIEGDISDPEIFNNVIAEAQKQKCDFLLATPPCQGMSLAGKMSEYDPRNILIIKVVEAIIKLEPKYVLIENVVQMLNTFIILHGEKIKITDFIDQSLSDKYNISFNSVNACDYNVPQQRKRLITLISRKDQEVWKIPLPFNHVKTVRETIGHLPSLESGEDSGIKWHHAKVHNDNHIRWMRNTPTGKSAFDNLVHYPQKDGRRIKGYMNTYKRLEWDKPSHTITTANGVLSSQNNVHPGKERDDKLYSDARVLTILEVMLLSTLPEDWNIPDWASDSLIRKVIGEGIPPRLIYEITKPLAKKEG